MHYIKFRSYSGMNHPSIAATLGEQNFGRYVGVAFLH